MLLFFFVISNMATRNISHGNASSTHKDAESKDAHSVSKRFCIGLAMKCKMPEVVLKIRPGPIILSHRV